MGLVPGFLVLLICWVVPIACSYFAVLGISAVCLPVPVFPQFFLSFQSLVDLCTVFYVIISFANSMESACVVLSFLQAVQ